MITPKQLLALTAKWLAIFVLATFCAVFLGDELSFQYRVHSSPSANVYGSVDMQHMLAIELKGGKIEYTMDRQRPAQIQSCVHSLFPHAGLSPCWYLLRRSAKAIPMTMVSAFPRFRPRIPALQLAPRPF